MRGVRLTLGSSKEPTRFFVGGAAKALPTLPGRLPLCAVGVEVTARPKVEALGEFAAEVGDTLAEPAEDDDGVVTSGVRPSLGVEVVPTTPAPERRLDVAFSSGGRGRKIPSSRFIFGRATPAEVPNKSALLLLPMCASSPNVAAAAAAAKFLVAVVVESKLHASALPALTA